MCGEKTAELLRVSIVPTKQRVVRKEVERHETPSTINCPRISERRTRMMNNRKQENLQKQLVILKDQLAKMMDYARDNCSDETWKDVFVTEARMALMRVEMMQKECNDTVETPERRAG